MIKIQSFHGETGVTTPRHRLGVYGDHALIRPHGAPLSHTNKIQSIT